ncbi:2966_t:CDS:2, partial [Diversispora eburnea]
LMAKGKKQASSSSVSSSSDSTVFKYKRGETVLCFHGPTAYPAQILDFRILYENEGGDVGPQYQVHYKGWNKKWDEWVSESRILKMTEENMAAVANTKSSNAGPSNVTAVSTNPESMENNNDINSIASDNNKSTKAPILKGRGPKNVVGIRVFKRARKNKISVNVSNQGMLRLIDEWQWNTRNQLLVHPLPRPNTVDQILEEFCNFQIEELKNSGRNHGRISKTQETLIREQVAGVREYFTESLPIYLLYRFERQQYVEMTEKYPKRPTSSIYGAEHLMRLVVKIPDLVHGVQMKEQKAEALEKLFNDLAKFLETHCQLCFAKQYEFAAPSYIRVIWEY